MTPIDDSAAFLLPRLALVVVLAATASVVESPATATATRAARVLRGAVLATLSVAALAGVLAGPLGPHTAATVWARRGIDPVCCETVSVQVCDADDDLRLLR